MYEVLEMRQETQELPGSKASFNQRQQRAGMRG